MEQWKFYKETKSRNWHRIYEVSDHGNAKINGVLVDFSKRKTKGYYALGQESLHRIIAKLFVPNPNNYPCVDHINGDIHDNRAENLRWCTNKMNHNYPLARQHKSDSHKGKDPWNKNLPKELQPMYGKEPWNKGIKINI